MAEAPVPIPPDVLVAVLAAASPPKVYSWRVSPSKFVSMACVAF